MKVKIITSAILIGLTATAAQATSLNLRHEFQDGKGKAESQHKDRLLLDHRFENGIGLSAEVKWANPKGEGFDLGELHDAGHEVVVSYNYKVTDTFTLQPAYGADSNTNGITHKFNLKGT
ncbi:MAG: oligogalacturonate-specific porin KdgM family protein, partial [Vibrio fluvialis]